MSVETLCSSLGIKPHNVGVYITGGSKNHT